MNILKQFLTPNKWSRPQLPMAEVRGIVVHWVAAPGQDANGTWDYFENRKNGNDGFGSAQFIIGLKGQIIQTMPLTEKAYAVGLGGFEPQPAYDNIFGGSPNRYTISIECNHIDDRGKMTGETYASLIYLCVKLCKDYKLDPLKQLFLHHDITTKICHKYFVNNPKEWQHFKTVISDLLK